MPKLVVDPKGRYSWEANFNPVLRMSHNAISTVKFKMDVENAKYRNTLKRLDWNAKEELRITEKELEQVRNELFQLKAYKKVARLTAFEKFDPVLRRHTEEKERQKKLREETDRINKEIAARKEEEEQVALKQIGNYDSMSLLSKKRPEIPQGTLDEVEQLRDQQRRRSMSGNVVVTLQDIMDNDSVLKHHSVQISDYRRKSQQGLATSLDSSDIKVKSWLRNNPSRRRSGTGSIPDVVAAMQDGQDKTRSGSVPALNVITDDSSDHLRHSDTVSNMSSSSVAGTHRGGSLGNLVDEVIYEHDSLVLKSENDSGLQSPRAGKTKVSSEKNKILRGVFITAVDVPNDDDDETTSDTEPDQQTEVQESKTVDHILAELMKKRRGGKPLTKFQLRKLYEEHQHQEMARMEQEKKRREEERNKRRLSAVSLIVHTSRRKNLRSIEEERQQAQGSVTDRPTKENSSAEDCGAEKFPENTETEPVNEGEKAKPSILRGLDKFRSAVKAVAVQNNADKGEGEARFKNLAAAVVVHNSTSHGKVPRCFFLNSALTCPPSRGKKELPPLEASHRKEVDMKIRPLEMPESVRLEHQKKWEQLMTSVNRAVHWKVRALREDTGTMNPRQMRRQMKRNPREKQSILPGSCKTTWALKKYVKQEIQEVMTSWQPENVRRRRNRNLIDKLSLPQFVDRVKTTTSILRCFREYKEGQNNKGEAGEKEEEDTEDEESDDVDDNEEIVAGESAISPH